MPGNVSNISLGVRLRQLREAKGWSLTDLSERAGVSRSYLAQIESGESIPTQVKIMQLANALGALPSQLMGEEPDPDNLNIPEGLRKFAQSANLGSAEVQMLARIEYRGKRPSTPEEWKLLYNVIKGMLEE
jgi:transcriptional regulator with XRE-family HTH domain